MPHHAVKDREGFAVWITGTPGCGFNTVGELLGSFMLDYIGYRNSHMLPRQWICSLPLLRYKITDPELSNPYFHGFAQNYVDMAKQPWRRIYFIDVPKKQLAERVIAFREANSIKDGSTHKQVVDLLFGLQQQMKVNFRSRGIKVVAIDGLLTPAEIAKIIQQTPKN